jgi:hypothetical protein
LIQARTGFSSPLLFEADRAETAAPPLEAAERWAVDEALTVVLGLV